MERHPEGDLGGMTQFRPRCPRCGDLAEHAPEDACPRGGLPPRRPIRASRLLLVAAFHVVLSMVGIVVAMGLGMGAPGDPHGAILDASAEGLLAAAFLPAYLLDRLGAGMMRTG